MFTGAPLWRPIPENSITDAMVAQERPRIDKLARFFFEDVREATGLPIVGMGGIQTGRDALEFAACGARDIALGTVLFADPGAPARVRAELAAACEAAGVAVPDDATTQAKSPETERKVHA